MWESPGLLYANHTLGSFLLAELQSRILHHLLLHLLPSTLPHHAQHLHQALVHWERPCEEHQGELSRSWLLLCSLNKFNFRFLIKIFQRKLFRIIMDTIY